MMQKENMETIWEMNHMITTIFRPSSHSEDYTLIATFEKIEDAKRATASMKRFLKDMANLSEKHPVDWRPSDAILLREKKVVTFTVYTAGDLNDPAAVLEEWNPKKLEVYENYQDLRVTVTLPRGMSIEAAALILGRDDAEMIRWFTKHVGKPKVKIDEKVQLLTWTYKGDWIYDDSDGELHLDNVIPIEDRKCWTITMLNG